MVAMRRFFMALSSESCDPLSQAFISRERHEQTVIVGLTVLHEYQVRAARRRTAAIIIAAAPKPERQKTGVQVGGGDV
jgi:hypothetical protein